MKPAGHNVAPDGSRRAGRPPIPGVAWGETSRILRVRVSPTVLGGIRLMAARADVPVSELVRSILIAAVEGRRYRSQAEEGTR